MLTIFTTFANSEKRKKQLKYNNSNNCSIGRINSEITTINWFTFQHKFVQT